MILLISSLIFATDNHTSIFKINNKSKNNEFIKCEDISKCLKDIVASVKHSGCNENSDIKLETDGDSKFTIKNVDGSVLFECDGEISEEIYFELLDNFKNDCEINGNKDKMDLFRPWLMSHCPFYENSFDKNEDSSENLLNDETEVIENDETEVVKTDESVEVIADESDINSFKNYVSPPIERQDGDSDFFFEYEEYLDRLDKEEMAKLNSEYDDTVNANKSAKKNLIPEISTDELSNFTLTDEPANFTLTDEPANFTLTDEPDNFTLTDEPDNFTLTDEPANFTLTDEPANFTLTDESGNFTLTDEPDNFTLTDEQQVNLSKIKHFPTYIDNFTTGVPDLMSNQTDSNLVANNSGFKMSFITYGPIIGVCALLIAGLGYFFTKKRGNKVERKEYEEVALTDTPV